MFQCFSRDSIVNLIKRGEKFKYSVVSRRNYVDIFRIWAFSFAHKTGTVTRCFSRRQFYHQPENVLERLLNPSLLGLKNNQAGIRLLSVNGKCFKYHLTIVTGSRRGAGTTAQVFVRLIGSRSKTSKIALNSNFETGSIVQETLVVDHDLGEIVKVHIGHDNIGDQGVGWYLEHVDVVSPTNEEYYFPVQRWLGQSDFDTANLMPCFVKVRAASSLNEYSEKESLEADMQLPLKIEIGATAYPHPEKVKKDRIRGVVQSRYGHAGEDAYSISPVVLRADESRKKGESSRKPRLTTTSSFYVVCAVADGVYSWRHQGIDAGEYSRFVVNNIKNAAQKHVLPSTDSEEDFTSLSSMISRPDPKQLLRDTEEKLQLLPNLKGSCCVCVGCIDGERGILKVANLGDSGAIVIRRGSVVFRTPEQEHEFGFPFQLPVDSAEDAQEFSCNIFDGDVIILGSDGLFDNVSDDQIAKIVRKEVSDSESPNQADGLPKPGRKVSKGKLANILASEAFYNSVDKNLMTPYSLGASEAFNMVYSGGKMDDICCVVAIVSSDSGTNIHRFHL